MTTAPPYSKKVTDLWLKAQANIRRAFDHSGAEYTLIQGATLETAQANQGNKQYFRLNQSGRVNNPYHPNLRAAKYFFAVEMDDICMGTYIGIADTMRDPT